MNESLDAPLLTQGKPTEDITQPIEGSKVLITTPTYSGGVAVEYAGGLMSCAARKLFGNTAFVEGMPIRMARNFLAHGFYRKGLFEWMVSIDADIGFTWEDLSQLLSDPQEQPEGTSVTPDGRALIVNAEYMKHNNKNEVVTFGLGFTRIHRSVFQKMENAEFDGKPRIGQFYYYSDMMSDYYPEGVGFDGRWFYEDAGFWHLCRLCGITPRIETGTKLRHFGRAAFPYPPENGIMHRGRETQLTVNDR